MVNCEIAIKLCQHVGIRFGVLKQHLVPFTETPGKGYCTLPDCGLKQLSNVMSKCPTPLEGLLKCILVAPSEYSSPS